MVSCGVLTQIEEQPYFGRYRRVETVLAAFQHSQAGLQSNLGWNVSCESVVANVQKHWCVNSHTNEFMCMCMRVCVCEREQWQSGGLCDGCQRTDGGQGHEKGRKVPAQLVVGKTKIACVERVRTDQPRKEGTREASEWSQHLTTYAAKECQFQSAVCL